MRRWHSDSPTLIETDKAWNRWNKIDNNVKYEKNKRLYAWSSRFSEQDLQIEKAVVKPEAVGVRQGRRNAHLPQER